LKGLLYAEVGALLQSELDMDRADYALLLFKRLNELEMQDGPGALERVLNGLPEVVASQIRQELCRLLEVGDPQGEESDVSEISLGPPGKIPGG
jgi:hypothetical protein